MAKRPCPFSSSSSGHNPGKLPAVSGCSRNQVDQLLESLLSMADSPSFPLSLDCAFDRIIASAAVSGDEAYQSRLVDRAINLGLLLHESANRCARKRASIHNSLSWPLSPDLTIKVFSMLDTQSLIYAAASCLMFNKCAMDPLCYSHIDLTSVASKVNNAVVSTMIQRAGKALRSLKLAGPTPWINNRTTNGKNLSILTRSCLIPLCIENGTTGCFLRRLQLYHIGWMDTTSLCTALSACPHLIDLEIVGLNVDLKQVLGFVTGHCCSIEHLFFESSGRKNNLEPSTCVDFVSMCPNLTFLALRGLNLQDMEAQILAKGFRKLKYLDFSKSYSVTGHFLRDLGNHSGGNLLETLILRDCRCLKEVEVARFLASLIAGDFKFIRHIDISSTEGLASEDSWYSRSVHPNLPLEKVIEERPGINILADFSELPTQARSHDVEQTWNGESSDMDMLSEEYYNSEPGFSASSWDSSYSSDQSIGVEGSQDFSDPVVSEGSSEG